MKRLVLVVVAAIAMVVAPIAVASASSHTASHKTVSLSGGQSVSVTCSGKSLSVTKSGNVAVLVCASRPKVKASVAAPTTAAPPPTTAVPALGAYFACTGSTQEGVDITYGTDSSNLNGASQVPWSANLPLGTNVQFFDVSGQLQGAGSITCTTTVVYKQGGSTHTITKSGSAQGGYNIASAQICTDDNGGWETC
jgi:hypothetical protein